MERQRLQSRPGRAHGERPPPCEGERQLHHAPAVGESQDEGRLRLVRRRSPRRGGDRRRRPPAGRGQRPDAPAVGRQDGGLGTRRRPETLVAGHAAPIRREGAARRRRDGPRRGRRPHRLPHGRLRPREGADDQRRADVASRLRAALDLELGGDRRRAGLAQRIRHGARARVQGELRALDARHAEAVARPRLRREGRRQRLSGGRQGERDAGPRLGAARRGDAQRDRLLPQLAVDPLLGGRQQQDQRRAHEGDGRPQARTRPERRALHGLPHDLRSGRRRRGRIRGHDAEPPRGGGRRVDEEARPVDADRRDRIRPRGVRPPPLGPLLAAGLQLRLPAALLRREEDGLQLLRPDPGGVREGERGRLPGVLRQPRDGLARTLLLGVRGALLVGLQPARPQLGHRELPLVRTRRRRPHPEGELLRPPMLLFPDAAGQGPRALELSEEDGGQLLVSREG